MCTNPIFHPVYKIFVPCKKCYACQSASRLAWTFRMLQESLIRPQSVFITLTYDNNNLPYDDYSLSNKSYYKKKGVKDFAVLSKDHASQFLKDCQDVYRSLYGVKKTVFYNDKKSGVKKKRNIITSPLLRYKLTAEYGDLDNRPHYHLILWFPSDYQNFNIDNIKKVVDCIWQYGNVDVQDTSFANMNYVSKHQTKECQGNIYQKKVAPIFQKVSRYNGGLGSNYMQYVENQGYTRNSKITCVLPNSVKLPLPQFYRKKLFTENISDSEMQLLSFRTRERMYSQFRGFCRQNGYVKVYKMFVGLNLQNSDLTKWSIDVKNIWYKFLTTQRHLDIQKRFKVTHRKLERRFVSARFRNDKKQYNLLKNYLFN